MAGAARGQALPACRRRRRRSTARGWVGGNSGRAERLTCSRPLAVTFLPPPPNPLRPLPGKPCIATGPPLTYMNRQLKRHSNCYIVFCLCLFFFYFTFLSFSFNFLCFSFIFLSLPFTFLLLYAYSPQLIKNKTDPILF